MGVNDNRVANFESPYEVTGMLESSIYVRYLACRVVWLLRRIVVKATAKFWEIRKSSHQCSVVT